MIEGDPTKRPPECHTAENTYDCPHLTERDLTNMSGERYRCDVCGKSFFLDYEDMR